MKHSKKLSPSSAPALSVCSFFESDRAPSGSDASLGIYLHDVLENFLKEGGEPEFLELKFGATTHDVEGVRWSFDFIVQQIARSLDVPIDNVDTKKLVESGELRLEQRIVIFEEDGFSELTFGTGDVVFRDLVFDYKSGEVKSHKEQLAFYGLGEMQAKELPSVQAFEVFGRYRQSLRHFLSREEAEAIVRDTRFRKKNPEQFGRVPCDYCKFCANRFDCPTLSESALTVPDVVFDFDKRNDLLTALGVASIGSKDTTEKQREDALDHLQENSREVYFLYRFASQLEDWSKRLKDSISKLNTSEDVQIPGLKVVKKRGSVEVTDLAGLFSDSGMSADRFLSVCKLSFTDLADALELEEVENLFGGASGVPSNFISTRKPNAGHLKKGSKKDALEQFFAAYIGRKAGSTFSQVDKKNELARLSK